MQSSLKCLWNRRQGCSWALKEKTTENWLAAVRQDKACAFVADLLENALVKPDLLAL